VTAQGLTATPVSSPRHSVVAGRNAGSAISHIGILAAERTIAHGDNVFVFQIIGEIELPGNMAAHAIGWLDSLDDAKHESIMTWIDSIIKLNEEAPVKYTAVPASIVKKDPTTGRVKGRKFSCAGFVLACFEEALGIRLVVEENELPDVSRATLESVWGVALVRAARRYGLKSPGPSWKVLLPSYILHALSRPPKELPHRPTKPNPGFP